MNIAYISEKLTVCTFFKCKPKVHLEHQVSIHEPSSELSWIHSKQFEHNLPVQVSVSNPLGLYTKSCLLGVDYIIIHT